MNLHEIKKKKKKRKQILSSHIICALKTSKSLFISCLLCRVFFLYMNIKVSTCPFLSFLNEQHEFIFILKPENNVLFFIVLANLGSANLLQLVFCSPKTHYHVDQNVQVLYRPDISYLENIYMNCLVQILLRFVLLTSFYVTVASG